MPTSELEDKSEKYWHGFFQTALVIKGVTAVLEILGGFALLFISSDALYAAVSFLTSYDVIDDLKEFIVKYITHSSPQFTATGKLLGALYLLSHGIVRVFLVWALLKNKLWAYPISIALLAGFIFYQTFRYFHNHSYGLLLLTIFDIIVLILTFHEYWYVSKHRRAATS